MGRYTAHLASEAEYQAAIAEITAATRVKLVPEPDNPNDARAIMAITLDGKKLGNVERDSWLVKAMLDAKTPVASKITEIVAATPERPLRQIVLEVLTGQEATDVLARPDPPPPKRELPKPVKIGLLLIGVPIWALVVGMAVLSNNASQRAASSADKQGTVRLASPARAKQGSEATLKPKTPYAIVGPNDPMAPAQDALNQGDYLRAYQLWAYPPVTVAEQKSPTGVALHDAIQHEADRQSGYDRGSDEADQLADTWLPQLNAISEGRPNSLTEVWSRVDAIGEATLHLKDVSESGMTAAQKSVRNRFRSALIAKQSRLLPMLRATFVKLYGEVLWENNIDVRSGGVGNRTITITGFIYANRANISAAQSGLEENLRKLRFTRAAYEWVRGVGEVYTYTMSPPSDSAVGYWEGSTFISVE